MMIIQLHDETHPYGHREGPLGQRTVCDIPATSACIRRDDWSLVYPRCDDHIRDFNPEYWTTVPIGQASELQKRMIVQEYAERYAGYADAWNKHDIAATWRLVSKLTRPESDPAITTGAGDTLGQERGENESPKGGQWTWTSRKHRTTSIWNGPTKGVIPRHPVCPGAPG